MLAFLKILRENFVTILVALGGVFCSGLMYKVAVGWDAEQQHHNIEHAAEVQVGAIDGRLRALADELRVLRSMFELQKDISQAEFRSITAPTLDQYPMLFGIGWAPRSWEGGLAHFHLARVNLRKVGPVALTFDLAAEPRRLETLLQACDSASVAMTPQVALQPDKLPGVIMMLPIFQAGKPLRDIDERRANLLGMLVAAIDIETLFAEVVGRLFWDQLDFVVREGNATGEILHVHAPRSAGKALPTVAEIEGRHLIEHKIVRAGNQTWSITFAGSPAFLAQHETARPQAALILGLLLTAIATSNAVLLQRRQGRVREMVAFQTAALRESEARFAQAMQATADGIWEQDLETNRMTFVSPHTEEMLGYAVGSFTHPDFDVHKVFPDPAERKRSHQALAEHIQTGHPYACELRLRHARGELRWMRLRGIVARDAQGQPRRLVGSLRDITDEREAEAQRGRMLARFEALIQNTPLVMVVGFDRTHNVSLWNHAAERFFGFTPHQARGRRVRDLFPVAAEGEAFVDVLDQVWQTGLPHDSHETRTDVAGAARWMLVSVFPLIEAGQVIEVFAMGVDITVRKQLEDELRLHRDHLEDLVLSQTADLIRAKETAEQANHSKSEFLANMSHELRTPMHAVLSFARIGHFKATTAAPEKLQGYFEHIRASGERMLDLVNDLLDLSKLEAGRMEYVKTRVDLRRRVEDVAAELSPLFDGKALVCTFAMAAPDCHVRGDPKRLDQVIRNLLGNAIKFTPEGRHIFVELADDRMPIGRRASDAGRLRHALRLTIADEGIGIPAAELEAIFEKFTQSSLTDNGAGGTGLGLAICQEIVRAHGGIVRARNRPEGGAAFDVLLPHAGDDATAALDGSRAAHFGRSGSLTRKDSA